MDYNKRRGIATLICGISLLILSYGMINLSLLMLALVIPIALITIFAMKWSVYPQIKTWKEFWEWIFTPITVLRLMLKEARKEFEDLFK